jgi:anti-anti-sigma factor
MKRPATRALHSVSVNRRQRCGPEWKSNSRFAQGRHGQWLGVPDGVMPAGRETRPSEFLRVEYRGDRKAVIAVDGGLDVSEAPWFTARVGEALEKDPASVAVDAGHLTYMDSSGLRSLFLARAAAIQAGVAFSISEASPVLRNLAERTGRRRVLLDD